MHGAAALSRATFREYACDLKPVESFRAFTLLRLFASGAWKKSYVNYLITLTIQLATPTGNYETGFDIAVNYRDPV